MTPRRSDPPSPRRILIAHRLAVPMAEAIAAARPGLELRARQLKEVTADDLDWADTLVGFRRPRGFGKVRWIHSIGAGVDGFLDLAEPSSPAESSGSAAPSSRPVQPSALLTRASQPFGQEIGEYVVTRVLAACQHLSRFAEDQRARRWAPYSPRRARGTRAIVVGMGEVGTGIAEALEAIGVVVTGVARSGRAAEPSRPAEPSGRAVPPSRSFAVHPVSSLPDLVADADWLVLAAPHTRESHHLVGRELLERCRGAWLVNIARGGLVDEAALVEALDDGRLAGAALDVFEEEPLPEGSPLWGHPKVLFSPHVAGVTTVEGAVAGFLECLDALERGEVPRWVVDWERGY